MHSDYAIEPDDRDGYHVRVTGPDGSQVIVPNFLRWKDASEWVGEQARLEAEALFGQALRPAPPPQRAMAIRRPRPPRKE